MNCPATAIPMKSGIQVAGVSNQIRKGMINGIDAWIISHHGKVNLRYFTRIIPNKIFIVNDTADTIMMFMILNFELISSRRRCSY
jgi:hypothetical protein